MKRHLHTKGFTPLQISSVTGFTLTELMIASLIIAFTAAGTFVLLGSASQLSNRRSHRYEVFEYASQTLDTLKDYVSADTTNSFYELTGDDPGPTCPGGGVNRYALEELPIAGDQHCHPLPAGTLENQLGGERTYIIEDIDLSAIFDTDNDGDPTNDMDLKRITVTIDWTEPQ